MAAILSGLNVLMQFLTNVSMIQYEEVNSDFDVSFVATISANSRNLKGAKQVYLYMYNVHICIYCVCVMITKFPLSVSCHAQTTRD